MLFVYALNHILEASLLYYYTFSLYPHRRERYKDISIVGIGYLILFLIFLFENLFFNIATELLIFFWSFRYLTKERIHICFDDSVITILIISLSELIFDIPTVLFRSETLFEYPSLLVALFAVMIQRLTHLVLLKIILYFRKRNAQIEKTHQEEILSTLLIITCATASISIQELGFISILPSKQIPWVYTVLFSVVSLSAGSLFSLSLARKKQAELTSVRNELQRLEDEENYEKILLQLDEEQRILIHDFRKHLQIIQENLDDNDVQSAKQHIENLTESKALSGSSSLTSNHTLSVLLSRYQTLCKKENISLSLDVKDADLNYLSPGDITSLFCNLMDNAMEASLFSDSPGIALHISKNTQRSLDIITITNTCKSSPQFDSSGFLLSHKKDTAQHGFGMKSIQRVVERYQGTMDLNYIEENCLFQTTICLYSEGPENENSNLRR